LTNLEKEEKKERKKHALKRKHHIHQAHKCEWEWGSLLSLLFHMQSDLPATPCAVPKKIPKKKFHATLAQTPCAVHIVYALVRGKQLSNYEETIGIHPNVAVDLIHVFLFHIHTPKLDLDPPFPFIIIFN
jgi:hypothetical protein